MDFALGLLPGVAHAVSTIIVGYPFDTLKTRLQTGMYKCEWPIAPVSYTHLTLPTKA